jgi:hypothetical protein
VNGSDAGALPVTGQGEGGAVLGEEAPLTWESGWMGVDETLSAWLDRVHPLQYGFDDLGRYFSPDPAPGRIASGGRFNRCPTCEQWSPCTVRERVAQARADGAAEEREQIAAELQGATVWADPMGRWTAAEAEAARGQKAVMLAVIARGAS